MARSQLLVFLVAVIAYYATAQTCTTSDSQLTISPYTPTASGYRNELITPLTLNATVRLPQYTNYTWVVTQIPNGLGYQVFPDKMGILVTGTPAYAGSYTMNVFLFYYDTAVSKQRCSIQPIYFNIQCRTPFTISPSQQSGIQGTAYSPAGVQFQVTGGSGSGYSFSANFQNPQNGVNLTTAGALVGTWSAPQTFGFYLTIVDDGLCEDSFLYTVTVSCPTLTIAPISGNLPSDLTINYYNSSLTTSGGLAPYTYALDFETKRANLVQNSLPTGFYLASDGTVYGTPAAASTSSFSVVVADVNNCQGYGTFNLEIDCPTITLGSINGSTLVDKDYSSTVVASGGSAPYTYVIDFIDKRANNFGLPPGLTLASSGVISGKPIAIGTYLFTVLATDAKGCTQSNDYVIQVSCDNLAIGDITTTGIAATSYYASLTTTLGSGTYTYTTEDNLANDLVLSSSGILQGELKETGLFTFTVVSTDTRTCQATRQFTLNITCPTLVLANQIADQAQASKYYSSFAQCDDGVGPYTLVSATGLPNGMTASNFNFFGIPTEIGLFNVTIIAADTNDCVNTFYMPLNITCAAFEFDTEIDTSATVDASYSYKFGLTSGFIAPVSFDVSNGTLPRGLTLASDGTLSGTPTLRGDFPIIVRATDDNGCTGEYALTISVDCANSQLSVNPSLESGQTGVYYTDSFSASGSSHHPYSYSVTPLWNVGVQLPYGVQKQVVKPDLQGWTLCYQGTYANGITDSDLEEIGICAEENGAQYAMLACGTDADNFHNMAAGPIEVVFTDLYEPTTVNGVTWYWFDYNDGPTQASWGFADGSVQFDYEAVCDNAEGDKRTCWYIDHNAPGRAGYRCGDLIGDQATDLHRYVYVANQTPTIPLDTEETYTLLQNGTIYGLPTISGDLGYRVTVTDDAGCPASAEGVLHIDCGKFYVQDLPVSQVTITYLQSLIISGGSGFYSAVITGLPQGLTYDAEVNRLSGVPVEHGVYPIVIDITDNINPCNYTVRTNITVLCPPNYMTDIPPVAKVGTTYLANINYINMVAPVHFETSSLLPYGLTLYRNGTIEGVPSLPGYYEFFINLIQDRPNGCSDGRWYAISVVCGPVDITDISNNFLLGDSVDETFDSSNGIQQYTYVVASGQLPDGLTLDPTGHLSGTVTKAGFFRFSVRATDTYNCVGERRFVVAVTCTEPIALGPLDTSFMLGEEVSMTPEILGGVAPYSFQLLLGTLPRGLALSTDGNITGTLTKVGAYVFQLGVRDSQGCVATELYTVTVVAPPTSQPPVTAPVTAPIAVPIAAPVAAPVVNAPVATGSEQPTPTPVPVAAPVDAPVEQAPIAAPVQAPVQSLVQAPTASPGAVSGQSSLYSAISVILSVCLIVLVSM